MQAIARVQTPPGRGGIAVIALSGDGAEHLLADLFRPRPTHTDAPAGAIQLGRLVDGRGEMLDEAVIARTAAGAIEINIHGGPAVARAVLDRLAELGCAVAAPQSAAPESFGLAHPTWNNPAIGAELLEVLPDAAGDLAVAAISQQWSTGVSALVAGGRATAAQLREATARYEMMRKLLSPPEVVLVGPPNVGKSTLANVLVGRPVSIVHATPGTTRDWVREQAVLHGVAIWLTDTAGLFEFPDDPQGVDAEAVRRARHRAEGGDLVLLLSAGAEATETPEWLHAKTLLRVAAKADEARPAGSFDAVVSADTGEGLDDLKRAILVAVGLDDIDPASPAAFTQRQVDLLIAIADALDAQDRSAAEVAANRLLTGGAEGDGKAPACL